MALFDRDQGRDRGYRGGYDRDLGDRMRHGWERVEQGFRGRDPNDVGMRGDTHMRTDYENRSTRDYGADFGAWGGRDMSPTEAGWRGGGMNRGGMNAGRYDLSRGENFDVENRWGSAGYDREMRPGHGYDAGYRSRPTGYGADYGPGYATTGRYGRGLGYEPGFPRDRGYDRYDYKSRQQTDTGDPFGDRQSRTPVRMVNEDYTDRLARRNAYDADVRRDRDWF